MIIFLFFYALMYASGVRLLQWGAVLSSPMVALAVAVTFDGRHARLRGTLLVAASLVGVYLWVVL